MDEATWQACTDPERLLGFLRQRASDRKLWLFAVACCRRVWHRIPDPRSRLAIETVERFLEGEVTGQALEAARREAEAAQHDPGPGRTWPTGACAAVATALAPQWNPDRWPCVQSVAWQARCAAAQFAALSGKNRQGRKRHWMHGQANEAVAQCALLHDLFGNPFHRVNLNPAWLAPIVVSLARAAYDERDLPSGHLDSARLAVLADALEEAGCLDQDILMHLRGPGPHVRGCWPVDLLTERA